MGRQLGKIFEVLAIWNNILNISNLKYFEDCQFGILFWILSICNNLRVVNWKYYFEY